MTLEEAKALLTANGHAFELLAFENEAAYWHHAMRFPAIKNARPCKVIALILGSVHGKKNIELQFNAADDGFRFEELRFGDYGFEMFDCREEILANELLDCIHAVKSGSLRVIVAYDMKKRRWCGDACYDLNDDDDAFGEAGFQKAMQRIERPKGFFSRRFGTKTQYEIYDWNAYQCIVK